MHTGDQRILGQHEIAPRRGREQRGIIREAQRAGAGKGREITGDEGEFAGAGGCFVHQKAYTRLLDGATIAA